MNAPATAEKSALAPAPFALGYTPLADGCFRNTSRLFLAEDGSYYALEWTPTLNDQEHPGDVLIEHIKSCTRAGGGWQVPTREELFTLVSVASHEPATHDELKADTQSDWYITSDKAAWSSGHVWFVYFYGGLVSSFVPGYGGFARGVRRVPVLAGQ